VSAFDYGEWPERVVHAHLLAGAEWRLHDPQRPLTHDRLLYVIQRPFGRITSMPATGQLRTYSQVADGGRSMARSLLSRRAEFSEGVLRGTVTWKSGKPRAKAPLSLKTAFGYCALA
jgi:hypothetical protein